MGYLETGFDSRAYRDGAECQKIYQTDYRTLSRKVLEEYHAIQTLISRTVKWRISWNVWDVYCGLPFYDLSLDVLPLSQESILENSSWLCVVRIPFIEGVAVSDILHWRYILEKLIWGSDIPNYLKLALLEKLADGNTKFQKTWDKQWKMIIMDLASQIPPYCKFYNERISKYM